MIAWVSSYIASPVMLTRPGPMRSCARAASLPVEGGLDELAAGLGFVTRHRSRYHLPSELHAACQPYSTPYLASQFVRV